VVKTHWLGNVALERCSSSLSRRGGQPRTTTKDLSDRLVEHDHWHSARLLEQAATPLTKPSIATPRGTVMRSLVGLPLVQYQLLRLRDRRPNRAALALEEAIVGSAPRT